MTKSNITSFTLPSADLKWIVDGTVVAASRDDIAPSICAVRWVVTEKELRLVATDRYRMHTATLPIQGAPAPAEFTAPLSLMQWVQRNARAFWREWPKVGENVAPVKVEFDPETGLIAFEVLTPNAGVALRMSGEAVKGNFPSMLTLLASARESEPFAGPVGLKPKFFGDLGKLAQRDDTPKMVLTSNPTSDSKPGPVIFTYAGTGGDVYAEALIQPNLLIR
ncbi:DNA polymerase III subunit beta family protein [Mycetocola spongiae]|uniref:DNA polymerase III subunit beta family protein n=1 Tax=Mycetocola spongiae TaxID=2859226 RepID=UPI001CF418CA|nr:hypothetical protein [Mycetocola spongiae]UCR89284.1 hypothetical protein KXZ72_00785 [Mycetocola spongiae]